MTTPPLDLPAHDALHPTLAEAVARGDAAYGAGGDAEAVALAAAAPLLARAEAAEKAVARVREALGRHPRACDRHTEDDPIKCGWKRAVADVTHALDGTPYRTLSTEPLVSTHHNPETETP